MIVAGQIRQGAYFDSVTLMRVGKELTGLPGVIDAAVVMGTKSNKAILNSTGLLVSEFIGAGDADLLIAVKARTQQAAGAAWAAVDGLLKKTAHTAAPLTEMHPASLSGALDILSDANLALISVAGRYAGAEAKCGLENGLHVMLFSDNVPLAEEIALKRLARRRGLLVMGPDCGTAIINGVPLGFANVVNRGTIGIVAAAGTGLQEVSCLISEAGAGISQAIGTGGRDVKQKVGGSMFLAALDALAADAATRVILLVAKPPDRQVLRRIERAAKAIRKPVITLLIGAPRTDTGPATLEEAALQAVALAQGRHPHEAGQQLAARDGEIRRIARREAGRRMKGQRFVRGLFSGGTFCAEAQVIFAGMLSDVYSNAPLGRTKRIRDPLVSQKHTVIDLGEDEFTVGRPHPMIDYSLRNRRIAQEVADPATAVVLLDVVLGYGAHPDPAAELADVIRRAARRVSVVCSVTGTDRDPQNRSRVVAALRKAGALVMPSNAAACELAGRIVEFSRRK